MSKATWPLPRPGPASTQAELSHGYGKTKGILWAPAWGLGVSSSKTEQEGERRWDVRTLPGPTPAGARTVKYFTTKQSYSKD